MSCNKCGSKFDHAEQRGPHIGLYCDECGSWIRWLSKDEAQGYKVLQPEAAQLRKKENHAQSRRSDIKISMTLKDYCLRSGNTTIMNNGVLSCCNFNCGNSQTIVQHCPLCGKLVIEKNYF